MFRNIVLALCVIGVATAQENFKDCLQKDSISCIQLAVRKYKSGLKSEKILLEFLRKSVRNSQKIHKKIVENI